MRKLAIFAALGLLLAGVAVIAWRGWFFRPTDEAVELYFTRSEEPEIKVFPVSRRLPIIRDPAEKMTALVGMLLEGPSEEEIAAGYSTQLPPGVTVNGARLEGDIIYLDFSRDIETGGGTATMKGRLVQIVYTTTQFKPTARVRFLIDGEMIMYFSGDGLTEVEKPVGRLDFNLEE